ncbi:putative lysophospholipid acyltransferase [Clavispora lusitaniae]|uniref:Lysophospholipid acyltransferase n=1 Tax=Clavispora lusitaniae TaxID=36911 RepID=A0ACD0WN43_CLALS|nr:putative lysophospholipid acyltransferase [Clavispora lusitaniae]QFZ34657.1 putative lysophospholipid acyltransferase [Clavispora lusitaniae]QFZ40342.1 putative lysophospholipid acyltransferase [Clavispora lusitaniae]QFZ46022.1 putative lysophospholipid acyltransferase [Clavispora lusitaniae]QFZ51684.1 putative lysophospholipid acyltransferase [Clavispora lusitaniae]
MITSLQKSISQLSAASGIDEAQFKILLCTLLSFPFSAIFKRLPDTRYSLKNFYVVGVSAFYIFGVLDIKYGLWPLVFSATGCYFITRYLRTDSMPWINFLFLMTHLSYSHIHAQFFNEYDPTVIDITGAQMVLVMKLSAFGWNVHDGKQATQPSEYTKQRAIKKHPNVLPYMGYVFFYPSLLTGPAFDYVDYDKFIHSTLFDDVPEEKRPGKKRKRRIPRSGRQSFYKVCQGVFFALLYLQLPKYVNLDYVFSDGFVSHHSFLFRIFYLWILGIGHRLKYYTIWLIAEGACILCGIGYNGYDASTKKFKWNRVQNIAPFTFESGQNVHVCLEAWNMNTNKWLKHYVYTRIARRGAKPGFKSTLFTFATSAFWHGTRPGYYLTFVMGAFLQTLGKIYRRNLRPIFLEADGKTPKKSKIVYDFVSWIVTQLAFGFVCQPFVILDLNKSLYCWSTVYFYIPIATAVTLFLFKGPYAKPITKWCQSMAPTKPVAIKESKFTPEETAKVNDAFDLILNDKNQSPTLGLPPIEALNEASKEEFEAELKDLSEAWSSFLARKETSHNDLEALRDAYHNFTQEINEIISARTNELQNATNTKQE